MRQLFFFALFFVGFLLLGSIVPQQASAFIPPEPGQPYCSSLGGSCVASCSSPDTADYNGYCTNYRYTCCIKYVPPNPCNYNSGALNQSGCKCSAATGCRSGLECSEIARVTTNSNYVPNSLARCQFYSAGICMSYVAYTTTDYIAPYTFNNYQFDTFDLGQSYQKTFVGQSTANGYIATGICAVPNSTGGGGGGTAIPTYSISGQVFVDTNRNYTRDGAEVAYSGATMYLGGNASKSTTTNSSGNYSFNNLPAGNYTVTIVIPAGYVNVSQTQYSVTVGPNAGGRNFAIVNIYSISGNVFDDVNKDRVRDLISDSNPVMESNITSGIAMQSNGGTLSVNSPAGTYTVSNLFAGTYTVSYDTNTTPLPLGYFMIHPIPVGTMPQLILTVGPTCDQTIGLSYGATCSNGNINNANFAISNSIPWWQTYGLNARIDEGFVDKIPALPLYPPYASVADTANGSSNLVTPTPTFTPTPTPVPPPSATPTPVPVSYGSCRTGDGYYGTCYDRSTTPCGTYYDAGWYCPGGDNIQCCVNTNVTCRSGAGVCRNRYPNPSYIVGSNNGNTYYCNKTWYNGYCPGPADVQCCAP